MLEQPSNVAKVYNMFEQLINVASSVVSCILPAARFNATCIFMLLLVKYCQISSLYKPSGFT